MISEEDLRKELEEIYSMYLENSEDKANRKKAYDLHVRYFNGANTLFSNISAAIWAAYELSEGELSADKAKKILESIRKQ